MYGSARRTETDDSFSLKRQNYRTISLVVVTLVYLLAGAVMWAENNKNYFFIIF